jgi:hypothetical protein
LYGEVQSPSKSVWEAKRGYWRACVIRIKWIRVVWQGEGGGEGVPLIGVMTRDKELMRENGVKMFLFYGARISQEGNKQDKWDRKESTG